MFFGLHMCYAQSYDISLYTRAYMNLFNLVLGDLMTLLTEQLRNIGQHILFSALYSSAMMASPP